MDTNHPFLPSKLNALKCAKCYQPESNHGKSVTCESCARISQLTLINGIWLCPDCLERELSTPVHVDEKKVIQVIEPKIENDHRPAQIEHDSINRLGASFISKSEDFFNAQTKSFASRWKEIESDESITKENKHYAMAKEVREFYLNMKSVLFQAVEVQLECASKQRASQVYLNQLASKLKEEERVKLHLQNIDYQPPVPKSAPKSVKLSKDDQIAEKYAKIMNIPIETARRLLNNKLKEIVGECTCKETPGICRIHSK